MSVPRGIARLDASLQTLRRNFAVSLAPATPAEARLVEEQLDIARQGAWSTKYALPVGAVVIALALSAWVPLWRTLAWPAAITLGVVAFEIAAAWLDRRDDHSREGVAFRARVVTAISFAQSITWAGMVVVLWPGDTQAGQTLLFLVVACTLAGWSSMGAVHFANGFASLLVYIATLALMPLFGGNPLAVFLSTLSVAFGFMMGSLFMTNYETREKLLSLAFERGQLVDDLKSAKADSDRARERAELASRAKSAFLANMSHELRTPLNAILGFSEIIQTRALASIERYSEYGGYINGSGQHLLTLINDILDLAKIEAGRLSLNEAEMELKPAMENAVVLMSGQAASGEVALALDIEDGFPPIYADERAVRQILTNLASNAVKFTPPGGHVVLFARLDASGAPCFGVSDDGVGIAPEDHDTVFESFGQGRHDAVIADRGTGLGLPIVRGLVEAMDGTVALESAPNKGTCVTVTLPARRVRSGRKDQAA
ncbi:MAG TPA: ATP-binding protein [Rhizomicrobium sp.]|nr:ATP-binding protein [Rhizomicrobium sp.]